MQDKIVTFVSDRIGQAVDQQDWDTTEVARVLTLCERLLNAAPEFFKVSEASGCQAAA